MQLLSALVYLAVIAGAVSGAGLFNNLHPQLEDLLAERLFPELVNFWEKVHYEWPKHVLPDMQKLAHERKEHLREAENCTDVPECYVKAMNLTASDEHRISKAFNDSKAPHALIDAWPRYAQALRYITDTYGNGSSARASADNMLYNATGNDWKYYMEAYGTYLASNYSGHTLPPFDSVQTAVKLVHANERGNALWYPQLWSIVNAKPLAKSKNMCWDDYEYSAILVPGMGPELKDERLSPQSKLRANIAAVQLAENKAPFIITSGGAVHPPHTPFTEAIELRNWLVGEHNVSDERVLAEPYARHTTTNLRNSARQLRFIHAPEHKPVLIATNSDQYRYILGAPPHSPNTSVTAAGMSWVGYKLGTFEAVDKHFLIKYHPNWSKISFVDPMDPLDP